MAPVGRNLDFLIIGSGKSGTTSLAYLINHHFDLLITEPKEPWFFDTNDYHKGMDWYWKQYLSEYAGESFVGEASSQTLFVPYVAQRVKDTSPDAKLIAILRNPVTRAYSDWWMKSGGKWEGDSFDVAIKKNLNQLEAGVDFSDPSVWQNHIDAFKKGRLEYKTYVDYGFYAKQLERYYNVFPRENIHVLLFEDLVKNLKLTTKSVWEFIGLDKLDDIFLDESPKNTAERRFYCYFLNIRRKFKVFDSMAYLLPTEFKKRAHVIMKNIGPKKKAKPSRKMVKMLSSLYRTDLELLETMIQRDLSSWYNVL